MATSLDKLTDHEREVFWINNLQHALKMMANLTDEQVGLNGWCTGTGCGTIACFGGWCALDPFFQSLGVTLHEHHLYPIIDELYLYEFEVAGYLFGDDLLFYARFHGELSGPNAELSDRAIVLRRITQRLRQLGVEA